MSAWICSLAAGIVEVESVHSNIVVNQHCPLTRFESVALYNAPSPVFQILAITLADAAFGRRAWAEGWSNLIVTDDDALAARGQLLDVVVALFHICDFGDKRQLAILHKSALEVLEAARNDGELLPVNLARHKFGKSSAVEKVAADLRTYVTTLLGLEDVAVAKHQAVFNALSNDERQRRHEEVAQACGALLTDQCPELSPEKTLDEKTSAIRDALSTLKMNAHDARALVRAAFRALGYNGPALMRAEDMANVRARKNKKKSPSS